MYHFRLPARVFALSVSLLAAFGPLAGSSPLYAAPQDLTRPAPPDSPDDRSGGDSMRDPSGSVGYDNSGYDNSGYDNSRDFSDSYGSDGGDSTQNPDRSDGTDSAIGPNGNAVPNPSVGVPVSSPEPATATRTGKTNRRRVPPTPPNPLVITGPPRENGRTPVRETPGNRLPPLVSPQRPNDYTIPTDPAQSGLRRYSRPLPLFGYDFFQPARQIIIARRRALLPAPRRTTTRTGTRSSASSTRTGSTGTGLAGGRQNPNTDLSTDLSADLNGDGIPDSQQRLPARPSSEPNPTRDYLSRYGADADTGYGTGADTGYGTDAGDAYNNSSSDYPGSGDSADPSQNNFQNNSQNNFRIGGPGDDPLTGADPYGEGRARPNSPPARRRTRADTDPFAGDYATPGNDIQFPGDDALVRGQGAANALAGDVSDPLATLYRNVLTSLPPNYQLQPGDQLTVRYSALTITPRESVTTVDTQGGITVSGVGRVIVVGRTAAQAEAVLRQRLERLYRNVDVSISLRGLRTIQVTVSGAAFAPGTYNVPATATAFNVLNAAGGPTANGSLRDIRVLRNGRAVGVLDIYPLIGATAASPGAKNGDINLQSGDNIYIPARLSRVAARGEVRQEAIYELKPGETLRDILAYSGGVKPSGVDQLVHIDTLNNGTDRVIRDVSLRDKALVATVPVYDGDTIEVSSIRSILTNRVSVNGAVDQPGDFALTPGMRVLDLIQRARGVIYNTYLERADVTRLNPDGTSTLLPINLAKALDGDPAQNLPLVRFDRLRLYSQQEASYLGRRVVTVRGAVQRPGLYTQSDNMRVSDLLLKTGGPLPNAYLNRAVLLHQRGDGSYLYSYVNLAAIASGETAEDKPVLNNDVLAVYKIGEAHFTPDHTVKVLGDVVAPGLYARGEEMRLSDLLKLAGAFKPGGGTRVTVAHARQAGTNKPTQVAPITVALNAQGVGTGSDLVLQDGDIVAVQGNGSIKDHPAVVTVTGAVNRPGPIIIDTNTRLTDAIKEAGGLRPEAFPQGTEFTRTSDALITTGQSNLAQVITQMSDLLNLSQYQRERAKANLALIEAAGSAASGAGSSGIAIPGLSPGGAAAPNPNVAGLVENLRTINPVSPGRLLTPSQLQPNGSVAVRLAEAMKRPGGNEDVLLKDGDTIVVPETPTTVQVVGAVFNARGVLYRPGESIDYYLQRAGDVTPDAARDRIEVIHAGGGLIPAGKAGAIQPGDLILVPTKVLAEKVGRSGNGFSAFFQGLVGSAISLKVLTSVFGL